MAGEFDLAQMQRMVLTARLCVRQSASWRPTMGQVGVSSLSSVQSSLKINKKKKHLLTTLLISCSEVMLAREKLIIYMPQNWRMPFLLFFVLWNAGCAGVDRGPNRHEEI